MICNNAAESSGRAERFGRLAPMTDGAVLRCHLSDVRPEYRAGPAPRVRRASADRLTANPRRRCPIRAQRFQVQRSFIKRAMCAPRWKPPTPEVDDAGAERRGWSRGRRTCCCSRATFARDKQNRLSRKVTMRATYPIRGWTTVQFSARGLPGASRQVTVDVRRIGAVSGISNAPRMNARQTFEPYRTRPISVKAHISATMSPKIHTCRGIAPRAGGSCPPIVRRSEQRRPSRRPSRATRSSIASRQMACCSRRARFRSAPARSRWASSSRRCASVAMHTNALPRLSAADIARAISLPSTRLGIGELDESRLGFLGGNALHGHFPRHSFVAWHFLRPAFRSSIGLSRVAQSDSGRHDLIGRVKAPPIRLLRLEIRGNQRHRAKRA